MEFLELEGDAMAKIKVFGVGGWWRQRSEQHD